MIDELFDERRDQHSWQDRDEIKCAAWGSVGCEVPWLGLPCVGTLKSELLRLSVLDEGACKILTAFPEISNVLVLCQTNLTD